MLRLSKFSSQINLAFLDSTYWGLPGGSVVKNPPTSAGVVGSILGSERSPGEENGNPLQYSCLGNPTDRRSLAGYGPCGCKTVGHNSATK